jgi:threonine synthase
VDEECVVCDRCGGLLDVEYDYGAVQSQFERGDLEKSAVWGLRRYLKVLPIRSESLVSLGESCTPVVPARRLLTSVDLNFKLDYAMPTGSFKDRGAATIVSKASELGVKTTAIDSSGNAAASVSAYAARAGIPCYVFVPHYTHSAKIVQVCATGATAIKVRGTREDVHNLIEAAYRKLGWYYCGFMVSPYAIEGMKTIAYEICEQLHWAPPDWISRISVGFPVSSGGRM